MKRVSAALAGIAFCTLFAASASAQANLSLRGIGLKAGVVNPEDLDSTLGLGLILDLGTIHPNFALESYAGYWSQSDDIYGAEYGVNDFSFGGKVKYMFQTSNPTVQPYAGAGLGLHIMNAHVDTDAVYFGGSLLYPAQSVSDTETKIGLDLGGGLRIDRGSQFAFIGEGWFSIVSDISQFSLMIGAEYMFGR